jgi:hypothetical protein
LSVLRCPLIVGFGCPPRVLPIIEASSGARQYLLDHIGSGTIIIIDFGEHYRTVLTDVFEQFGHAPPTRAEAIDFVLKAKQHRELARDILQLARESALYATAVPKIESLLREVIHRSSIPLGSDGTLIDRQALRELSDQSFHELVVRFSVAFADALAPDNQAAAISRVLKEQGLLAPGTVQVVTLGSAVLGELVFDMGDAQAFKLVREAHDKVVEHVTQARESFLLQSMRASTVAQDDSNKVLGIQAADIAARIAAVRYERHGNDRHAGAMSVKQLFDRVLLNDRWI